MNDEQQFPDSARRAWDDYPQIEPSPAFNRAVFERLEAQKARRATFIGRVEEFLGLDLWQFAASGMLGALLPALLLGALYLSNRTSAPAQPSPKEPLPFPPMRAIGPFYAREWEFRARFRADEPVKGPQSNNTSISGDEISCVDFTSHLA